MTFTRARHKHALAAGAALGAAVLPVMGVPAPIYYDMEAYPARRSLIALEFFTAWTTEVHLLGYRSGIYSSSDSGVTDLVDNYANPTLTMPDVIFDAWWNGVATSTPATSPRPTAASGSTSTGTSSTSTSGGGAGSPAPSSRPDRPRPGWPAVPGDVIGECGQLFVEGRWREAFYAANTGDAGWHGPRPGSPWTGPGGPGGG
jgi:Rv2525c-like, glycoside hydrolase-like domain